MHPHLVDLIPPPPPPSDLTTDAGLLQQSMVILLRLTHPWCQTILREITLRINVVPLIIPRISIEKLLLFRRRS